MLVNTGIILIFCKFVLQGIQDHLLNDIAPTIDLSQRELELHYDGVDGASGTTPLDSFADEIAVNVTNARNDLECFISNMEELHEAIDDWCQFLGQAEVELQKCKGNCSSLVALEQKYERLQVKVSVT